MEPADVGGFDADGDRAELAIKSVEGALPIPGGEDERRPVAVTASGCRVSVTGIVVVSMVSVEADGG
jgi:hypothetical protein